MNGLLGLIFKTIIIGSLITVAGGTSLAIAQPDNDLASPFRGIATGALEVSSFIVDIFEDTREVAAKHERSVISTTLQAMRVKEGLTEVTAVAVPTNDMASFPSAAHPLYPGYLDRRFTEFKYTIDSKGTLSVDISAVTTENMLDEIQNKLQQLKEAK